MTFDDRMIWLAIGIAISWGATTLAQRAERNQTATAEKNAAFRIQEIQWAAQWARDQLAKSEASVSERVQLQTQALGRMAEIIERLDQTVGNLAVRVMGGRPSPERAVQIGSHEDRSPFTPPTINPAPTPPQMATKNSRRVEGADRSSAAPS